MEDKSTSQKKISSLEEEVRLDPAKAELLANLLCSKGRDLTTFEGVKSFIDAINAASIFIPTSNGDSNSSGKVENTISGSESNVDSESSTSSGKVENFNVDSECSSSSKEEDSSLDVGIKIEASFDKYIEQIDTPLTHKILFKILVSAFYFVNSKIYGIKVKYPSWDTSDPVIKQWLVILLMTVEIAGVKLGFPLNGYTLEMIRGFSN